MFVLTLNKKHSGKIIVSVLMVCVVIAVAGGIKKFVYRNQETMAVSAATVEMTTTQQMADYILSKGYTVDLQSAQVKEVKIPRKFDAEFENFNDKIRQTDGLSLEKYKNDRVSKWTFNIMDYDVENKTAVAALLVRKDKLIGAYVIQLPEGTAHPLSKDIFSADILE